MILYRLLDDPIYVFLNSRIPNSFLSSFFFLLHSKFIYGSGIENWTGARAQENDYVLVNYIYNRKLRERERARPEGKFRDCRIYMYMYFSFFFSSPLNRERDYKSAGERIDFATHR